MLLLNNDEVRSLLSMKICLEALEAGYEDLIRGDAVHRPRIDVWAPCDEVNGYYRWGSMEGVAKSTGVFAIRMKSDVLYWPDGKTEEKYCVRPGTYCGLIMLFSTRNGEPLAIMPDGYLQHMRVGGCAGLGVKYLSRQDSHIVGILGSGDMARTYLTAFNEVRSIHSVKVFSPTKDHRTAYAKEMSERLGLPVEPLDNPRHVVSGSDVVATCTDSNLAVVEDPSWIEKGMHLTNLRFSEWSPEVVSHCDVVIKLGKNTIDVSDEEAVRLHGQTAFVAGQPEEKARIPQPAVDMYKGHFSFLTDLLTHRVEGRKNPDQITFFINAGTQGLQFAAVAGRVYHLAKERAMGRELPTEWFLQDIRD